MAGEVKNRLNSNEYVQNIKLEIYKGSNSKIFYCLITFIISSNPDLHSITHLIYTSMRYYHSWIKRNAFILIYGDGIMAVLSPPTQNTLRVDKWYLRIKRILDLVLTILILIPLIIVIGIFAALIRIDSKGPIFFLQKRIGMNGVEFGMFKLRSMYVDSDDAVHRESIKQYINGAALNGKEMTVNLYKLVDDPRVTRVGRFIRKYSIDELPQFINVLHGEMSLVGPRPPLPYEVEEYSPRDMIRLSGKPGLTGTWQVYGRSRVPFKKMVEMDIEYLQEQSILQDFKLIALTLPVMLQGRGGV
jgi:lipopolysaccharide/colanic/teichoic acid biosynthesis glycosyltransferase